MKKLLFICALLPWVVSAQEEGSTDDTSLKNKNGVVILPETGDWGLSISSDVALRYFGNIFTGSTPNNNTAWWQNPNSPVFVIRGKYFISPSFALRGGARVHYSRSTNYFNVVDDAGTGPDDYLEDRQTINNTGVTLLAGAEFRRGSSRVQGFYGGEIFASFNQNTNYNYEYANAITEFNQAPSSTSFSAPVSGPYPANRYRILEARQGANFTAGARAFIGVEVFVLPKISIGGNFAWDIVYSGSASRSTTWENWEAQTSQVAEYTLGSQNGSFFDADISNASGSITANFYF